MFEGRTPEEKARLADAIVQAFVDTLGSTEASLSVAVQDVAPADWAEGVYRPDILETRAELYKRPGYDPFKG
jgi:4-oxalocrotonate tautomerase